MRREPAAYLWDVCDAAERIGEFIAAVDASRFAKDMLVRSAVERQFEIIGEALNQLSKVAPGIIAEIPDAAKIIAFRNILIHGYTRVDHRIVWSAAIHELPRLIAVARRLLDRESPAGESR